MFTRFSFIWGVTKGRIGLGLSNVCFNNFQDWSKNIIIYILFEITVNIFGVFIAYIKLHIDMYLFTDPAHVITLWFLRVICSFHQINKSFSDLFSQVDKNNLFVQLRLNNKTPFTLKYKSLLLW